MDQADNKQKELEKREDETIDKVAHALIAIARDIVSKEDAKKKHDHQTKKKTKTATR